MTDRRIEHVVIRASAGTGKTHQLTNRFIRLLVEGVAPEQILAVTFTRKAAGEILQRVLKRLAQAAVDSDEAVTLAEQIGRPGLTPQQFGAVVHRLVRSTHRLNIGTLDSFFARVCGAFSLELGLPMGWRIGSQTQLERLRRQAVEAVLESEPTGPMIELLRQRVAGQTHRGVTDRLDRLFEGMHIHFRQAPQLEQWDWLEPRPAVEPQRIEQAVDRLVALADDLPKTNRGTPNKNWQKAVADAIHRGHARDLMGIVAKGIGEKLFKGEDTYSRVPIPERFVQAFEPLVNQAIADRINELVARNRATYQLLKRYDLASRRLQAARGLLQFDDLTIALAVAALLNACESVFYRLDGRVGHMLLDEFQDTSVIQWLAIRPLAREITAHDPAGGEFRSFFCVGDVKQAIYGWRGGDARIFDSLDEALGPLQSEPMDRSYRSCPQVIDTINQVFGRLTDNPALIDRHEAVAGWSEQFIEHESARPKLNGYCELRVSGGAAEQADATEKPNRVLVDAADLVVDLARRMPGTSIGLLTRKNKAVARLMYELRRRGVHASEEGGNPLTDSPAVSVMLSLLTMADHPADSAARFHVARSPLGPIVGLTAFGDDRQAAQVASRLRRSLAVEGYGAVVSRLAMELARPCSQRDRRRLMQLAELAGAYEPDATVRPGDFVRLVRQQRIDDPATAPVRVMTIHQAKGLAFDIVILPELDGDLVQTGGQRDGVMVDRRSPLEPIQRISVVPNKDIANLDDRLKAMSDQLDERLMAEALSGVYVAMTRAVHMVVMLIQPSNPTEKKLPASAAGLLRGALAPDRPAEPQAVLWSHGEPDWYEKAGDMQSAMPAAPTDQAQPAAEIQLADLPQRQRNLMRRTPSDRTGQAMLDVNQLLDLERDIAALRGSVMHEWFAEVNWLSDGLPEQSRLRSIAGALGASPRQVDEWLSQWHRALEYPAIAELLGRPGDDRPRTLWRERPFALRRGDELITGRLDRVVVVGPTDRPAGASVVDFKTDALAPTIPVDQQLDALVEHYRGQIEDYRYAVTSMTGLDQAEVDAIIAFTSVGEVRRL